MKYIWDTYLSKLSEEELAKLWKDYDVQFEKEFKVFIGDVAKKGITDTSKEKKKSRHRKR